MIPNEHSMSLRGLGKSVIDGKLRLIKKIQPACGRSMFSESLNGLSATNTKGIGV